MDGPNSVLRVHFLERHIGKSYLDQPYKQESLPLQPLKYETTADQNQMVNRGLAIREWAQVKSQRDLSLSVDDELTMMLSLN
jgi:hypothetical protein